MATQLAIDSSDMDIAVQGIAQDGRSQALQQIHERLRQEHCPSVTSNVLIATASVPVVKLEIDFEKLVQELAPEMVVPPDVK